MLFSELYKIMMKKDTFVGFRGGGSLPLDPPLGVVITVYDDSGVVLYLYFAKNPQ